MVEDGMTDLALLVLRVVTGGLLMEPEQTPGSADERTAPAEAA
jgi:hypothetical protein